MGWKGALRSTGSTMRRLAREAEREAIRREKEDKLEESRAIVEKFENYIEHILSIHKEVSQKPINWQALLEKKAPSEPQRLTSHEDKAKQKYDSFSPNIFYKLFKREERVRQKLEEKVAKGKKQDEKEYCSAKATYQKDYAEWEFVVNLAERVLKKDASAYLEGLRKFNPFTSMEELLGTQLELSVDTDAQIIVNIDVHCDEVIPKEKYSLRQSGILLVKKMPKGEFNELYQDFVCSCLLRVASEVFAVVPSEEIIVNAVDDMLNTKTGHMEKQTILSVRFVKETIARMNLKSIDPSDSMDNFLSNMKFKKTSGFSAVEPLAF